MHTRIAAELRLEAFMVFQRYSGQAPHAIRLRKGIDVALRGAPKQEVGDGQPVRSVGLLGHDYPGIRPNFRVQTGDQVCRGDVLFVDRKRPEIAFTSPATGIVTSVNHGHRRSLDSIVVSISEDDDPKIFEIADGIPSRSDMAELLQKSGQWTAFLSRPFGRIPDPNDSPDGIFVTAIDTNPLAGDACVAIAPYITQFRHGLRAIKVLTEGQIFVCQPPGEPMARDDDHIQTVFCEGPHPAGLAGTHIHALMPVSAQRQVWQIGYQDIVAIGHLIETGEVWTDRIISLAGPGVCRPRLVRTRLGADLGDLLEGESRDAHQRVISGSVLSGKIAGHLGRYHTQVSVLDAELSSSSSRLARLVSAFPKAPAGPLIPLEAFERALSLNILAVPLMRALSVGDTDMAERLGCRELLEEDVALLSYLCPGGADYSTLLRLALDELEEPRT